MKKITKTITGLAMVLALSGCGQGKLIETAKITEEKSDSIQRKVVEMPDLCRNGRVLSAGYGLSYFGGAHQRISIPWISCEDQRGNIHVYRLDGGKWYGVTFEKKN